MTDEEMADAVGAALCGLPRGQDQYLSWEMDLTKVRVDIRGKTRKLVVTIYYEAEEE